MPWLMLIVAGCFEVVWVYFMKQSNGFTKLVPSLLTIATMGVSFGLLACAMKTIPLGTSYVIWTGIGAVGAFAVEVIFLGGNGSPMRIGAAILIVSGLIVMKFAS